MFIFETSSNVEHHNFTITDKLKGNSSAMANELPFNLLSEENSPYGEKLSVMKEEILGKNYELSLVLISSEEARELNWAYRKKDSPADILSFPLSKNSGEIFICPEETVKEAPKFGRGAENFLYFLFIHGLLHLKGFDHGSKMEAMERAYREQFGV